MIATKSILIIWSVYTTFANNPIPGNPTPGVSDPTVTTIEFGDAAACNAAGKQLIDKWNASAIGPLKGRMAINWLCLDSGKHKGD